ncbi:MAG TPA: DUF47 family protein [Egibacteraceae bacterium]|nr:DUF47 family protein [Egibacteraceae bacterium]
MTDHQRVREGRLRRLLRDLSGRGDEIFVTHLTGQIDATLEGVRIALGAVEGGDTSTARDRMGGVEHEGDDERAQLVEELARALTTPIDREDLFRLSRSIDDVLDNLRDFTRELDLFRPRDRNSLAPLIEAVRGGMEALRVAVGYLVERPADVADASKNAKRHGNELRRLYQHALADLYRGELTIETLKNRDLLRRLDVVGLRLDEAADALADGVLKRSH